MNKFPEELWVARHRTGTLLAGESPQPSGDFASEPHAKYIRADIRSSSVPREVVNFLQAVSQAGYYSAEFSTAEQLVQILDEYKDGADKALALLGGVKKPVDRPEDLK